MTFEDLKKIVNTPLDCVCGGNGIVLETQSPCAEHFLYSTCEEFRLESLRLTYANLQAFVVHHGKEIGLHLPKTKKQVNKVIELIHKPQTPEEWVRGIQAYILNVLSYYLCAEEEEEEEDSYTFENALLTLFPEHMLAQK